MEIDTARNLLENYLSWLREKTQISKIGDQVQIATPFLNQHNDHILLYIKKTEGGFEISDDSQTISELLMTGFKFTTERRNKLINVTLNSHGIELRGEELIAKASSEREFAQKKHDMLQAIMSINDLYLLAQPFVLSTFLEDVQKYLAEYDVRYVASIKVTGASGLDHYFDFVIPASRNRPERMILAMASPSRDRVSTLLFMWQDTVKARSSDASAYAFLNDQEKPVSSYLLTALSSYKINPVLWTKRKEYAEELTA